MLLAIGGVLNIVCGIAGIGHAKVFASNQHYFLGGLKSWGWAALILGVLEIMAAMSLLRGGELGRWSAIVHQEIRQARASGASLSVNRGELRPPT